jgi:hypothetical protein
VVGAVAGVSNLLKIKQQEAFPALMVFAGTLPEEKQVWFP